MSPATGSFSYPITFSLFSFLHDGGGRATIGSDTDSAAIAFVPIDSADFFPFALDDGPSRTFIGAPATGNAVFHDSVGHGSPYFAIIL
jgi:hypothetical protein